MIIGFDAAGLPSLHDAGDFKRFKVVLTGRETLPETEGVRLVDGHAHVDVEWLIGLAGTAAGAEWRADLDRMIEKARPVGWIDERGAIRAHIELA